MRVRASSMMSWNRRSSRLGAVSGIALLLFFRRNQIERVDERAGVFGRSHAIGEADIHAAGYVQVGADRDVQHVDARLPHSERVIDVVARQAPGRLVVRSEDEVVDLTAEVWTHAPLALGGAEDDAYRLLDIG